MTHRLGVLVILLVLVAACYLVVIRAGPVPGRSKPRPAPPGPPAEGEAAFIKPGPYPTEYDEITVTIEIPPVSEFPSGWAQTDGCPHMRVSRTLGAAVGPGNGCPVLVVEPDGPAAKAGIQPMDRLGKPSDCISSFYRIFRPRKEARTVEWTIRRPKTPASESPGPDAPAAKSDQQEASG